MEVARRRRSSGARVGGVERPRRGYGSQQTKLRAFYAYDPCLGWDCKYDIAAAAGACRVFHQKPSAYVWLAAASNETGRLLAACFGDAWRERVARVHPPRKHKGTT